MNSSQKILNGTVERCWFICPHCNEEISHYSDHLKKHFPDSELYRIEIRSKTCHMCDKVFQSVPRMMNHLKRVHAYYSCKCKYCLFACGMPQELVNHHELLHLEKEAFLFCVMCSERIAVKEYAAHCTDCFKKQISGQNVGWKSRRYLPICNARRNLKRKQEAGLCEQCGHARSDCGHVSHSIVSPEKKPRLKRQRAPSRPCPTCGKQYLNHSAMEWHIRTAHENFTFKCDMCEKKYKGRDSLRMHKDEKHGIPRFPCSDCDLMFNSVNQRWAHYNKKHKLVK